MADDEEPPLLLEFREPPLAVLLGDYQSMVDDLRHVAECCRLLAVPDEALVGDIEPERATVIHALWESAVITYGRSFEDGKSADGNARTPFPRELIESLTNDQRALHDEIEAERDWHVAHRISDATHKARVIVTLPLLGDPPELAVQVRTATASVDQLRAAQLAELATLLAESVEEAMRPLFGQVAQATYERLPQAYAEASYEVSLQIGWRADPNGLRRKRNARRKRRERVAADERPAGMSGLLTAIVRGEALDERIQVVGVEGGEQSVGHLGHRRPPRDRRQSPS